MEARENNLVFVDFTENTTPEIKFKQVDVPTDGAIEIPIMKEYLPPVTATMTGLDKTLNVQTNLMFPKDTKEDAEMNNDDWLKLYLDKLNKEHEQDRIARDKMIEKFETLSSKTSNELKDLNKEIESYKIENRRFNIGLLLSVLLGFIAMIYSMVQINQGFTQIIQSLLK